jgi:hypothetical protein
MIGRRMILKGAAAVTGDGLARPVNAPRANQAVPGIQPGSPAVVNRVIVAGVNGGVFVYDPTVTPGKIIASVSDAPTGPAGEGIVKGITAYIRNALGNIRGTVSLNQPAPSGLGSTHVWSGLSVNDYITPASGNGGVYGQVSNTSAIMVLASGEETGADVGAAITLTSQAHSGLTNGLIQLGAGRIDAFGPVTAAPGGAPASFTTLALSGSWAQIVGESLEIKLMPDNTVAIHGQITIPAGVTGPANTIAVIPAAFRPLNRDEPVYMMETGPSATFTTTPHFGLIRTTGNFDVFAAATAGNVMRIQIRYPIDGTSN